MAEWQKILISAVVGLFAGLVAEPLRTLLQQSLTKRRISLLLIDEILENSSSVLVSIKLAKGIESMVEEQKSEVKASASFTLLLSTERYDYVRDRERSVLYLIKGYKRIDEFFKALKQFSGRSLPLSSNDEYNLLIQFDSMKYAAKHDRLTRLFKKKLIGGKEIRLIHAAEMFVEFPEVEDDTNDIAP